MPDFSPEFRYIDRALGVNLYEALFELFDYLNAIDPSEIGALKDEDGINDPRNIPYLRFSEGGAERYRYWIESLLTEVKKGDFHPALANHFSKYEKLIPGLALLAHLGDHKFGSIDEISVQKALDFGDYLKTHAERIYTCSTGIHAKHAKLILQKIKIGLLQNQFTARDRYKKRWSSLTELDDVLEAIKLLVKYGWFVAEKVETGGKPKAVYSLNKAANL